MLRLLADENIPGPLVRRLREAGFDVVYVAEDSPGALDPDVLARAGRSRRFLLTEDRDFGQLVYARRAPGSPGVIYLRLGDVPPTESMDVLLRVLTSGRAFAEHFTTVSGTGLVRQRPLPTR